MTQPPRARHARRTVALVAVALVSSALTWQATTAPPAAAGQVQVDPELVAGLEGLVAFYPRSSCLRVDIEGTTVFSHATDQPLVPASTEKLITGAVAMDVLGKDHRFRTSVKGPAPADGVVTGDLTLVGSGDPLLTTDPYELVRRIGPDQPTTSLEALADAVAGSGVRWVTGRVVGDESRYDQQRHVATWPERYVEQNQSGPLSALSVNDGFVLLPGEGPDDPIRRERSADPATDAARALTDLLIARGVVVEGAPAAGPAPAGATELAAVESAPLGEIVRQLLEQSDNQTGELLTKELGVAAGSGGSTDAGLEVIRRRGGELGYVQAGSQVVDGSGLDTGNRVTCDQLVTVLQATGGADGTLGNRLPVAGENGTLEDRFGDNPAAGRLRAKTGTLRSVSALAGFVDLPEGGTATFSYVVNDVEVTSQLLAIQDRLGEVLGTHVAPCPDTPAASVIAPVGPYAGQAGTLSMLPLQTVLVPAMVVPLAAFEQQQAALVDRCLAADDTFDLELIVDRSGVGSGDIPGGAGRPLPGGGA